MKTILRSILPIIFFVMMMPASAGNIEIAQSQTDYYQNCMRDCAFKCQVRSKLVPGALAPSQVAAAQKYQACFRQCPSRCALRND